MCRAEINQGKIISMRLNDCYATCALVVIYHVINKLLQACCVSISNAIYLLFLLGCGAFFIFENNIKGNNKCILHAA